MQKLIEAISRNDEYLHCILSKRRRFLFLRTWKTIGRKCAWFSLFRLQKLYRHVSMSTSRQRQYSRRTISAACQRTRGKFQWKVSPPLFSMDKLIRQEDSQSSFSTFRNFGYKFAHGIIRGWTLLYSPHLHDQIALLVFGVRQVTFGRTDLFPDSFASRSPQC